MDRGDEEAFRLLYRRHTPRLYAVALRLLAGRSADAEDVVQDAWLRSAARLADFEWRSALSTWLIAIVINCARERLRMRPIVTAEPDDVAQVVARPESPHVAIDLERAIAALPDRRRQVLVLHDIEGWTHAEIGRHLDMPAGTSKSDLFQARRAVRASLTARTAEVPDHAG
ncbi:MAG TPA: RNA polymerase sigma factor [Vicinamibacterales bacterium]|nr:RNA polymerase sigma factor [Vicinamibacterales bacterium]